MIGRWAAMLRRRVEGLPPPAVDAVIAVLCYLATVALPLKVFREGGWPLFVLAALASVPLVWRRPAPVAVAALVGAGTIGLAVTGTLGNIPLPYGQLVATYTVAIALALIPINEKKLEIVPGATHLFEEPGTLEEAARLATDWFRIYLE